MTYGTIKVDTVTFTNAGVDKSITLSGLVQNPVFSGNVTVTGTLSGVTVTGTTANFTSGNFTNISGGTHTITSGVFAAGSAASPSITFTGDLNTGIYSPGADQVAISTGGSGRLFVDASGRVSVGTATAQRQFVIYDTTFPVIQLVNSTTGALSNNGLLIYQSGANTGISNQAAGYLALETNNAERLRITSAGLVGVGTSEPNGLRLGFAPSTSQKNGIDYVNSSPGTFTDIWAAGLSGGWQGAIRFFVSGNATPSTPAMVIDSGGRVGVGTTSPGTALDVNGVITSRSDSFAAIRFKSSTGTDKAFLSYEDGSTSVFLNNYGSGPIVFKTVDAERVRIDSSGRVGIGSSNPATDLFVEGNSTSRVEIRVKNNNATGSDKYIGMFAGGTSAPVSTWNNAGVIESAVGGNLVLSGYNDGILFQTGTSRTTRAVIDSSGRLGIGTTSPARPLDVNGSVRLSSGSVIEFGGTVTNFITGDNSSNYLAFGTNSSERLRIDSSGRLLVGTSSARSNFSNSDYTARLQVEGTDLRTSSISSTSNYSVSNAEGAGIWLNRSKGGTVGSITAVDANTELGLIVFQGADGTDFVNAAIIAAYVDGTPGANDMPGRLVFSVTRDGSASPTEAMRIKNTGDIVVAASSFGTPTPDVETTGFYSDSGYAAVLQFRTALTSNKTHVFFRNGNGQVGTITTNASATSYNTSSDYRLKENIAAVTDGITRLQQLKPSRFNFIADPAKTVDGFIAHEVQAVVPEAITGEKDAVDADGNPVYQGIDQSKLVPLLTAALQEAVAKIESLEARLTAACI